MLKYAIKDFIDNAKYNNLSLFTIDSYGIVLKEFYQFCIENGVTDVTKLNYSHVKNYLMHCKMERSNKPSTINSKLRITKTFFNYLIDIEIIEKNPTQKIKRIKEEKRIDILTDAEIKMVLKYFERIKIRENTIISHRNRLIVLTFLSTGIRRGELCNLRWRDVDFTQQTISVFGKKRSMRTIPLIEKLRKELAEWKIISRDLYGQETEFVFPNQQGKQLTIDGVSSMFKKVRKKLNIPKLNCQIFRHTFTSKAAQRGMTTDTLRAILGHESILLTQHYINLFGVDLKEQNERFNPLNDIDI
ncbi:tyrosine-type recombinase/integrase [Bacillus taeanensis]|uniref:tyrosine-type recombinase/integrase n=1 Tax=Bacillus taeanensis TaxID=273032 RepID=UPI0015F0F289|nr:tyrosine-type recombinase/integrase [Bacillus taeanensis]